MAKAMENLDKKKEKKCQISRPETKITNEKSTILYTVFLFLCVCVQHLQTSAWNVSTTVSAKCTNIPYQICAYVEMNKVENQRNKFDFCIVWRAVDSTPKNTPLILFVDVLKTYLQ
jgi:hypothetical protein